MPTSDYQLCESELWLHVGARIYLLTLLFLFAFMMVPVSFPSNHQRKISGLVTQDYFSVACPTLRCHDDHGRPVVGSISCKAAGSTCWKLSSVRSSLMYCYTNFLPILWKLQLFRVTWISFVVGLRNGYYVSIFPNVNT